MRVGDAISLRVVTPAGPTDVVGTLLAATPDSLTVRRRDGSVTQISVESVAAGRVVPPGPARTVGVADLQQIATRGWQPAETEPLGGWLLRAAGGFTGRANSALAVGDPGRPVAAAVAEVHRWYDERGLPPTVQLPGAEATAGVAAALDEQGWATSPTVLVMTAELGPLLRGADPLPDVDVRLDDEPDEAWLASYRPESPDRRDGTLPPAARALLVRHERAGFASVRNGNGSGCVAIARTAVDGRWAGLSCVEVAPSRRRGGLGAAVSLAALRAAVTAGARHAYLQVSADNQPAVALYERLGFTMHHDYVYRIGSVER